MSFLIPMNISDDTLSLLIETAVIRRSLCKNGGKGWYEDECKRSAAAMSWRHIEVEMVFYLSTYKKELDGKRRFSSNLGYWQFGIKIEDRSRVLVSMEGNDLIEAKSADNGQEGGLHASGFSLVVTVQQL